VVKCEVVRVMMAARPKLSVGKTAPERGNTVIAWIMVHHSIEYHSDGKRLSAIESRFVRNDSSKLGADVLPPFRAEQGWESVS
jgi:hypothetical protein